ncbi:hypothetical protein ACQ4PT_071225 [Festuca glaucescens]
MAGMEANLTDNSGWIAGAVDEEASSPSGNGEELPVAAADQTVEAAEAPQPLPNDERKACDDAPEPSQARREAENDDDSGDSTTTSYKNLLALQARVAQARARIEFERDLIVEFFPTVEQEEVSSSMGPVPSSAPPSGSEEQLAAAAAARALASRAADHHVNQPADAEAGAQPVPRDDESVGSAEPHR